MLSFPPRLSLQRQPAATHSPITSYQLTFTSYQLPVNHLTIHQLPIRQGIIAIHLSATSAVLLAPCTAGGFPTIPARVIARRSRSNLNRNSKLSTKNLSCLSHRGACRRTQNSFFSLCTCRQNNYNYTPAAALTPGAANSVDYWYSAEGGFSLSRYDLRITSDEIGARELGLRKFLDSSR